MEFYIERNMDQEEIADRFGVSGKTISRWLDKHNIDTTPKRTKKLRDAGWLEDQYWDENKSTVEIADELGCDSSTVCDWMEKHGIERRTAHHKKQYVPFYTDPHGYECWSTVVDETQTHYRVHRLVAFAEYGVGGIKDKVVHHKNGVKWDNRPENIELMGRAEHMERHKTNGDI